MSHVVILTGCAPTPLASYLKAIGIFRLVAEQADAGARGCWSASGFELASSLDLPELEHFFLELYRPTPIIAPWNGASGFYPRDNKSGIEPLSTSTADRLSDIREAILLTREVLAREDIGERPDGDGKHALLQLLRNELPDSALAWFDATVLLTDTNPRYPPLLGTGGNDGHLDFTNNFMQRLVDLFDPADGAAIGGAELLLHQALTGAAAPNLPSAAIGQFSPSAAGGPNGATGFKGGSVVNPWDFVLMLEGAVLFAAAATRRLESSSTAALSYPFTVRTTGSGSGTTALVDESSARAEIWMPIWSRPASFPELRTLFSDGRITLGRHVARDGLDAARAIAQYGSERGIEAFQRYGFLMRSGRAYLATPLSRVRVRRNTRVDLLDQLDSHGWLRSLRGIARSDEAPARVKTAIRRLEDAMFEVAESGEALALQRTLMALGEICAYLRTSRKARDASPYPPTLRREWSGDAANDGSAEFRIARSLAGIHALDPSRGDKIVMRMLAHFIPPASEGGKEWAAGDDHDVVWSSGSLESNLASVAQRRLLTWETLGLPDKPFISRTSASVSDIAAILGGRVDMDRMARLLAGLVLVTPNARHTRARSQEEHTAIPGAYFVLKPLFCTNQQLIESKILPKDGQLPLTPSIVLNLAQHRPDRALDEAYRRRRIAGMPALPRLSAAGLDGPLLLTALLVPVDMDELERIYESFSDRLAAASTTT